MSWKASPYLFPCIIEYSLIAAAVLHKMCSNIGLEFSHDNQQLHFAEDCSDCRKVTADIC